MATISTPHYLLDQARRRFTPTLNTIPGDAPQHAGRATV